MAVYPLLDLSAGWTVLLILVRHTLAANSTDSTAAAQQLAETTSVLVCPPQGLVSWELFPLPCEEDADCRVMGGRYVCCTRPSGDRACARGVTQGPAQANAIVSSTSAPFVSTSTSARSSSLPAIEKSTPSSAIASVRSTAVAPAGSNSEPTVIALSTAKPIKTAKPQKKATSAPEKKKPPTSKLACPRSPAFGSFSFLAVRCSTSRSRQGSDECGPKVGAGFVCCEGLCVRGVPPPLAQPSHSPFLGLIPRDCPVEPLGELLFDVTTCATDADCWPRVCCPDGQTRYCRTARPRLDLVPAVRQIATPFRDISAYVQCSAPPEIDLFPRQCSSAFDCLPNLCCQEAGRRNCRPPRRSLLALLAGVTQRVGSTLVAFQQFQRSTVNANAGQNT